MYLALIAFLLGYSSPFSQPTRMNNDGLKALYSRGTATVEPQSKRGPSVARGSTMSARDSLRRVDQPPALNTHVTRRSRRSLPKRTRASSLWGESWLTISTLGGRRSVGMPELGNPNVAGEVVPYGDGYAYGVKMELTRFVIPAIGVGLDAAVVSSHGSVHAETTALVPKVAVLVLPRRRVTPVLQGGVGRLTVTDRTPASMGGASIGLLGVLNERLSVYAGTTVLTFTYGVQFGVSIGYLFDFWGSSRLSVFPGPGPLLSGFGKPIP